MAVKIKSQAFREGEMIPQKYTCDGENISPPLRWTGIPPETKSLALINDDPDAPMGTWIHWVVYNLPPSLEELPEGVPPEREIRQGGVQGMNDFRKIGYGGPCPPGGTHRYYFKLYALNRELNLEPGASKEQLEEAMKGHILDQGSLMGKYSR